MSIRTRLLLLVLFATILPALLAAWHFLSDRDDAIRGAERTISALALNTARDLDDKVKGTSQLLYGLARARDIDSGNRTACSKFLSDVLDEYPQYTGILTILPDARLFCDSLQSGRELNLADRAYFQQAVKQLSGVAVEPAVGRLTGISVLQIAHPSRDDMGALHFVLLASLNLEKYMAQLAASPAFESMVFLTVDRQGTLLTRHPAAGTKPGASIAGTPIFQLASSLPNGGIGEEDAFDGQRRVWSAARLPDGYNSGLQILIGVAKNDLAAEANSNLIYAISILATLLVAVMLAAWLLAEMAIRRQVARIRTVANSLAAGELGARIPLPHPSGELGQLMGAINHSAGMLESHRRRIEELNLRFTALIKSSPAAIVCVDADRRVTLWNTAAEQIFGYKAEDVLGKPAPILFEDFEVLFADVHRRALQGVTIEDGKGRSKTKDGRTIDITFRAAPLHSSDSANREVVFIVSDTTEKLALEMRLLQAQKMEAVGQLTGGVAHDFNNLLTVILGNSEALVERLAPGSDLHGLADITMRAAIRGAELTNSLLAFSRKQALAPQIVDVNVMLKRMDGLLRRTLGEHIEIQLVADTSLWPAVVDPTQIESAILNLAVNARDAMGSGGRLTIETANVALDAKDARANSDARPGEYVMVAVSDTGTGMTPEVMARAFEPFFTTKDVGKGSGLGLSMVYGFIKQSGGHVKIYSELGHGTTFKLYLPRALEQAAAPHARGDASGIPSGDETILAVEDDELVRAHVESQLTSLGYRVVVAPDGARALDILRGPATIDLLFTDVVMPGGMNGPALVREALALRPRLKVLLTSGYTENAVVHHGRIDANVRLLSKPYRLRELAVKIRETLDAAPSGENA